MLVAVESSVWLPALSGAVGALLGAGASVLGSFISGRQQERQRRDERSAALRDREDEARRGVVSDAASTLGQAFSLLHDMRFIIDTRALSSAEQVVGVKQNWTPVRDQLFLLGVGYPEREAAEKAVALVGKLTEIVRSFMWLAEQAHEWDDAAENKLNELATSINDSLDLVIPLLNRVRSLANLPAVFPEG